MIVGERSNSLSGRAFFIATNLISCLYPKSQGEKASVLGEFDRSQCTGNYRPETLRFPGQSKSGKCSTHSPLSNQSSRWRRSLWLFSILHNPRLSRKNPPSTQPNYRLLSASRHPRVWNLDSLLNGSTKGGASRPSGIGAS